MEALLPFPGVDTLPTELLEPVKKKKKGCDAAKSLKLNQMLTVHTSYFTFPGMKQHKPMSMYFR